MTAPDPKTDLVLERHLDVPVDLVWKVWTQAEHLKRWWTPAPWKTTECKVDLRPGGEFSFAMQGPEEGQRASYRGCYLEIVEKKRVVWTLALGPGYRPAAGSPDIPAFTAVVTIEPAKNGTKYTAVAMHATEAAAKKHDDMGFHEGWGAALDQLVALAKSL